jgi:hypothetical protein
MGSITSTVVPAIGAVRLDIDWSDVPNAPSCLVYRVQNGTATLLRDGGPCLLSHSKAVVYDTECPLDTPVTYRTQVYLNRNGSFELNVEEWISGAGNTVTNGTVAQSTDYYAPGTGNASLKLTTTGGTGPQYVAASEEFPVTVGTSYTATARLMVPSAWAGGIGVGINWYTSGSVFLSTSGTAADLWPGAGTWGTYSTTGTAPATAAKARLVVLFAGSPPSTLALYADEVYASTAASTVDTAAPVQVQSNGQGWLKDPLHPWANLFMRIDLANTVKCVNPSLCVWLGEGDRTRPEDNTLQEVPDRSHGVGIWARRKAVRSSNRFATATIADRDALETVFLSGAPLLLQVPSKYGIPERYGLYGSLASGRLSGDMTLTWRAHSADYVEVLAPYGPAEGVLGARYVDETKYGTYAQASAAAVTWQQLLQGGLTG